jgi:cell division GTPase FtsZ
MKRRTLLKTLGLMGLGSALPKDIFANEASVTKLHFIGMGGAGTNFLEYVYLKDIKGNYTSINAKIRLAYESKFNWIPFQTKLTNTGNRLSGFDTNLTWNHFTNSDLVKEKFMKLEDYVLVAGLGGLTGTFLMKTLLQELLDADIPFKAIVFLPFEFERKNERKNIQSFVEQYRDFLQIKFVDLEVYKAQYGHLTMTNFFDLIHEEIYHEL